MLTANMSLFVRVHFIFLASACCAQMQMFHSSYFQITPQDDSYEMSDFSTVKVHDEFECASTCGLSDECECALFDDASKTCSLVTAKEKLKDYRQDTKEARPDKVMLEKVSVPENSKSSSDEGKNKDNTCVISGLKWENKTTDTSCCDILRKNSSSITGFYNMTVGNITWETKCRMNGIPGCGDGAWTQVMRINGSKNTFAFDSSEWTNKTSYRTGNQGQESKNPGYWLSSFTKICIMLHFPSHDQTAVMLVNHTTESLYSALHKGVEETVITNFSTIELFPWTPSSINKSCLIQRFNSPGPFPYMIKSRVGVESQTAKCDFPYLVRGVGIGYPGAPEMSCGEVTIDPSSDPTVKRYPAFCRIYVQ